MAPPGIEPATPCFPACRINHSDIGTINDMLLNFYTTFYTAINQHVWQSMYEIYFFRCELELTVLKICISFTNTDVIYCCLQNFVWTNQIKFDL